MSPFHLAIPVGDLVDCARFYEDVLGCRRGRESEDWIDLNFFGHQVVLHCVANHPRRDVGINDVDNEQIPVPHFGVVLDGPDFDAVAQRVEACGQAFVIAPTIRFQGRVGEQRTFFLRDPSGNCLEFKSFQNPQMLFERDLDRYE